MRETQVLGEKSVSAPFVRHNPTRTALGLNTVFRDEMTTTNALMLKTPLDRFCTALLKLTIDQKADYSFRISESVYNKFVSVDYIQSC
jgi:hypothetical protein